MRETQSPKASGRWLGRRIKRGKKQRSVGEEMRNEWDGEERQKMKRKEEWIRKVERCFTSAEERHGEEIHSTFLTSFLGTVCILTDIWNVLYAKLTQFTPALKLHKVCVLESSMFLEVFSVTVCQCELVAWGELQTARHCFLSAILHGRKASTHLLPVLWEWIPHYWEWPSHVNGRCGQSQRVFIR